MTISAKIGTKQERMMTMGLTMKQDNTLNELFDKFALDPKKSVEKPVAKKPKETKVEKKDDPKK
ncbi:SPJ_0845 family protein [Loigolactobacillus jiayinensis]|uniref:SPJ_0845 family protein n=1 Tax=Loigolactobacillus jiayinensis TaxID=2486016 RepID=A0ABW1RDW9_9LACO|nr:SPJ_0845 family protein [Loigolactobacillus jiayinensis]